MLLHIESRILACAAYLQKGYVPLKLQHIVDATRSLNTLEKYNPNWQSQPRVPSGDSDGGQWTSGGGGGASPSSPFIDVDIDDPPLESVYPVEALIGGLGALSARSILAAIRIVSGFTRAIYSNIKIQQAAKAIEAFFGGAPDIKINPAQDIVLMKNGKKIRFDVKNPHGEEPHFHIETKPISGRGKWPDSGNHHRYTFKGKD